MNTIENNLQRVKKLFGKSKLKAGELIKDSTKTRSRMGQALRKANTHKGNLNSVWSQLQLMISLVKDNMSGAYKLPKKSLIAIVAAILYFLSPLDLIPDFILGFGMIDDVFIISMVIKQVAQDLERYQLWKSVNA